MEPFVHLFISFGQSALGIRRESCPRYRGEGPQRVGSSMRGDANTGRNYGRYVTGIILSMPRVPHRWDCGEPLPPTSPREENDPKDQVSELLQESCMQGECWCPEILAWLVPLRLKVLISLTAPQLPWGKKPVQRPGPFM